MPCGGLKNLPVHCLCTFNTVFWTYLPMIAPYTHLNVNLPVVTDFLNADLDNFSDWCDDNDMKKNTSKSKAMFLSTKIIANKIMEDSPTLKIRGGQIQVSGTEKNC